jgi:hypothetical protein
MFLRGTSIARADDGRRSRLVFVLDGMTWIAGPSIAMTIWHEAHRDRNEGNHCPVDAALPRGAAVRYRPFGR